MEGISAGFDVHSWRFLEASMAAQRSCDLRADVSGILAACDDRERAVARLLAEGQSVAAISRAVQADWHTVRNHVSRLRSRFMKSGLQYWLES